MFRNARHIHLVAIGGIGMSGIAEILINLGFEVSGSDLHTSPLTDRLARLGARIHTGHAAGQVEGADVVVRSSAVTEANVEIVEARARRIPVIRRADMLAELMRLKYGICVAGSHGKTTTTSLVAAALSRTDLDPTVIVGGKVLATGSNASLGEGDYLIAEADESDGSFLRLTPTIAVVTNIDLEHVDYYPDLESLRAAFVDFLDRVPFYGACVLCNDDPEVRALAARVDRKVISYGFSEQADIRVEAGGISNTARGQEATVFARGEEFGTLVVPVRGRHNLLNVLAAVAVGWELSVPFAPIAAGLATFAGVSRRCEEHGEQGGVLVLDDYGHHPTEIIATMEVARNYGRRVVVLFQPHRYSRTARFVREFADALASAQVVGLLPVYAAGEDEIDGVNSGLLQAALAEKRGPQTTLLAGPEEVSLWLERQLRPGDLLLLLGAGDIGRLVKPICSQLERGRHV